MVCISDSNIYTPLKGCSGENVSPRNISIGISRNGLTNGLSEEDEDDLKMELAKTEDEMQTLRQVLLAKEKYAVDIKRQLGMGPFSEIKHNMSKGWHEVQTSNIQHSLPLCVSRYRMTHDTISHAGQISTAAMSTMGVAITRRLGEMRYPQVATDVMHFCFPIMASTHKPTDTHAHALAHAHTHIHCTDNLHLHVAS
uniref:Tpd52 like 2a n=1 Tax=Oncorhynchus mykiss TaxID=8022 RepID=A0A8K9XFU0_ONCMY